MFRNPFQWVVTRSKGKYCEPPSVYSVNNIIIRFAVFVRWCVNHFYLSPSSPPLQTPRTRPIHCVNSPPRNSTIRREIILALWGGRGGGWKTMAGAFFKIATPRPPCPRRAIINQLQTLRQFHCCADFLRVVDLCESCCSESKTGIFRFSSNFMGFRGPKYPGRENTEKLPITRGKS